MADPKSAARAAQDSTGFRVIARIGYALLGIVHIVIGAIAISIAIGGGGEADQGGAMAQIRDAPAGVLLLWAIAIGLTALAIWQLAESVLERDPDEKRKWGARIRYAGTAVVYAAVAVTAVIYAVGGESDSAEPSRSLSAQLMAAPAGAVIVALIGLAIAAVGIAFVVRGFTRAFEKKLDAPGGAARKGVVAFGMVGYTAKGVAVAVAGILFVAAAWTNDPQTAGGLDAALHALARLPFGALILWVVGAGLVIYGMFCFARARYARM